MKMNYDFVYDRVSNQAIRSMAFLFFKEIEKNGLDDDSLVKEINDFLKQISLVYRDIEDELPIAGNTLDNVRKLLISELSTFDSINDKAYQDKIRKYISSNYPYYMLVLFDEIIEDAKERNEMYDEYKKDPSKYAGVISKLIKEIQEIYDRENGNPKVRCSVTCPICSNGTDNYICVWDINKQVHFYCEHCEFNFNQ